ncbi:MAG: hydrogenase maturation protease [Acidobacteria bacterium]|nr:MAG: hydrogenase maturation protease [Acidobacteriota bacterium]
MSDLRILIAGIGNIFLGDDAFGCEVLKRISQRKWPAGVRVVDFGIRGFDLAYAMLEGDDLIILVDTTPRGEAPGTVYVIEPNLLELESLDASAMMVETHGMNPLKVLSMVKSMGGQLKKVILVGCEPETFGPEEGLMGLSPSVEAAVPEAVNIVESLVTKHLEAPMEMIA